MRVRDIVCVRAAGHSPRDMCSGCVRTRDRVPARTGSACLQFRYISVHPWQSRRRCCPCAKNWACQM